MTLDAFKISLKNQKIFERYGIEKIGIFGSIARGEDGNDIDILVEDTNYSICAFFYVQKIKVDISLKRL